MFYYRLKGPDFGINPEEMEDDEKELRVVLTAPHKDLTLEEEDIAFMLVQYVDEPDEPEESWNIIIPSFTDMYYACEKNIYTTRHF